jgi:predicted transcriptional regulator
MDTFGIIENIIKEAEEYYFYITKETLTTASGVIQTDRTLSKNVKGKGIKPEGFTRPEKIVESVPDNIWKKFDSYRTQGILENKYSESINFALFMNEKEVILDFPDHDGEFDYIGFTSKDKNSIEWCKDLFEHYWERASYSNS